MWWLCVFIIGDVSEDVVKDYARQLQGKWGYSKEKDETKMRSDIGIIQDFFQLSQPFYDDKDLSIITEHGNERMGIMSSFLKNNRSSVQILFVTGHGISHECATTLQGGVLDKTRWKCDNGVWKWPLHDVTEGLGMPHTPETVMRGAKKGDVGIFSCGLLTPEWVLGKIEERDVDQRQSTIIIILDSCYSGAWVDRMRKELQPNHIKHTRVILQSSCGPGESVAGVTFTPLWHQLQVADPDELSRLPDVQARDLQSRYNKEPRFLDSDHLDDQGDGYEEIALEGHTHRFFTQRDFFIKFAHSRDAYVRGIQQKAQAQARERGVQQDLNWDETRNQAFEAIQPFSPF